MNTKLLVSLGISLSFVLGAQAVMAKPAGSHVHKAVHHKTSDEDRAINLVDRLKEVQAWKKEFGPKHFNPATNGRPGLAVEEHHGAVFTVQVFEDQPDHVVTFARYQVNVKTGSVKKEDE
ncbi:MAG TPA: hypothetical protein V6C76_03075 [Drouetiella sp.]